MHPIAKISALILTLTLAIPGLSNSLQAADTPLKTYVSILPQKYFVKRIGGKRVEVNALVQPGDSPATYQPTPQQIAGLTESALYFSIGVPFEKTFLPKIRGFSKNLKIIDTRKGIRLRPMKAHQHPEDKAAHPDTGAVKDPHIWLNPLNVKIQARTITNALSSEDPAGKSEYEKNYLDFCNDLDKLNTYLSHTLQPLKGKTLMVFHPAWGYFAEQYGLKQEPIEIEGKSPSARQLTKIIDEAKKDNIRVIFVQPQFSKAAAQSVAEAIDGAVVPVNPLSPDYINNLKSIADKITAALSKQQ